jgi:hypothetical protein
MDTRTKILTAADLSALDPPRPLLAVTARFDVMRAVMVQELAAALGRTGANSLLAVVRPLPDELAPIAARAEMAASLRVVDYVFIAENGDLSSLPASLQPVEIVSLEEADAARIRQLIAHVHSRQSA